MLIAVTRAVSPTLPECELTHLPRDPINVADATAQHASYEAALRSLGATVVRAPDGPARSTGAVGDLGQRIDWRCRSRNCLLAIILRSRNGALEIGAGPCPKGPARPLRTS